METKKSLVILATLACVAIAGYGIYRGVGAPASSDEEQKNPCDVDVSALVLEKREGESMSDEEVVRAMFDHYFGEYQGMADCPAIDLADFRIESVSNVARPEEDHITADIAFDLKPASVEETEWDTPETSLEDGWIVGKLGTLSIIERDTYYYLVVW